MHPWFYVISVPVLWMAVSAINFHYPGDEYGGWGVGSLPGLWILPIVGTSGSPSRLVPYVLAAGGMVMATLGWAMDGLRTPLIPWAIVTAIAAGLFGAWALAPFPSWERAIAKNGSIQAYILPSFNLGLLSSTVLMIMVMFLRKGLSRRRVSGVKDATFGKLGEFLDG